MKWRFHHKARKAFLTMAICLALSQSVFAMPTGGKVVDGTVTGIVNGTVASGGTINVNSWSPDSRRFAFVEYRIRGIGTL